MSAFLFVTDLDRTLVGDDCALIDLIARLQLHRREFGTKIVYATGRSRESYSNLAAEKNLPAPDALVASVGTEIYFDTSYEIPSEAWAAVQVRGWNRHAIAAIAAQFPELEPQPPISQGRFKVSYFARADDAAAIGPQLDRALKAAGLVTQSIYSSGKHFDIMPAVADKGKAVCFLQKYWNWSADRTVVCGDSGNDIALFAGTVARGIIVGNAMPELLDWSDRNPSERCYRARSNYAAGILEGLQYLGFL